MKVKLTVGYRGESFRGWQAQGSNRPERTVQTALSEAIETFLRSEGKRIGIELADSIELVASGRTDAGVHAEGQVVSFTWPEKIAFVAERFALAVSAISKGALSIRSAELVPDSFHARFTPHFKSYCYRFDLSLRRNIFLKDTHWWTGPLAIEPMIHASRLFNGTHDFRAFRASDCNAKTTVRTLIRSEIARIDDSRLEYRVWGNGFLKQMVRVMAGTLCEVGRGGLEPGELEYLLRAGERKDAGQTAPACGLTLEWVRYPDEDTAALYGLKMSRMESSKSEGAFLKRSE